MTYNVYTDGSFIAKENRFGLGFLIPDLNLVKQGLPCENLQPFGYTIDIRNLGNDFIKSRNILGEVLASMIAIQKVKKANPQCEVIVNYDYSGVEKWITGEWKANNDLSQMYVVWFNWNNLRDTVKFNHTKAHTNDAGNNLADMYARSGQDGIIQPRIECKEVNGKDIFNLVLRTEDEEVRCGFSY